MTKLLNGSKVINYQPQLVWKLRNELRQLGVITDDDEYLQYFYHPRSFIGPFTQYIHDRTGAIRHFLPMRDYLRPLAKYNPEYQHRDKQQLFEELMCIRGELLLARDKLINVFWSGGLDSTSLLLTLIYLTKAADRKKIRVIGTHDSIVESGPIFDHYIAHSGCELAITPRWRREKLFETHLKMIDFDNEFFLDGHTADSFYGKQQIFAPQWRPDLLDDHWKDAVEKIHGKVEGRKIISFTEPAIHAGTYQPVLYRAFLWWYKLNFGLHQQTYASTASVAGKQAETVRFFDWDPFIQWAMVHGPSIIEQQPDKMPQRLWLWKLTQNSEYSFLKKRYRSTGTTFEVKWVFSLDNRQQVFEEHIRAALLAK